MRLVQTLLEHPDDFLAQLKRENVMFSFSYSALGNRPGNLKTHGVDSLYSCLHSWLDGKVTISFALTASRILYTKVTGTSLALQRQIAEDGDLANVMQNH